MYNSYINNAKGEYKMNTINITIDTNTGEMSVFTIEFKNEDFLKVVDEVEFATLENINSNPLWAVK